MSKIPMKPKNKTTVKDELEYWNVVHVIRRLNIWYGRHLNSVNTKRFQGMQSYDFSMNVITKIVSGSRSWENSQRACFLDFCYDVARSELHTWHKCKNRDLVSFDVKQENKSDLHIRDDYMGYY
jgi:hypothetical protein